MYNIQKAMCAVIYLARILWKSTLHKVEISSRAVLSPAGISGMTELEL